MFFNICTCDYVFTNELCLQVKTCDYIKITAACTFIISKVAKEVMLKKTCA